MECLLNVLTKTNCRWVLISPFLNLFNIKSALFPCYSWYSLCWRWPSTSVLKITLYVPSGGGKMLLLLGETGNMATSRRNGLPLDLHAARVSFLSPLYLLSNWPNGLETERWRLSAFANQKESWMLEMFYRVVLYNWNKQPSCQGLCGCIVVVHCWFGHVRPAYACHSVAVEVLGLVLECFSNTPY